MASARTAIPAGVMDAGFSSLATFGIGVVAVRLFDPATLGVYALAFSAFLVATILPRYLLYLPVEMRAIDLDYDERLDVFRQSVRLSWPILLVATAVVSFWLLVAPAGVSSGALLALAVTAAGATAVAPVQDHLRQLFHIAGVSWDATIVSFSQFVVAVLALLALWALPIQPAWIPIGAYTISYAASLLVGVVLLRRRARTGRHAPALEMSRLLRSGGWLLPIGILPSAATFATAGLVAHLAGAEALGYAEAARVVGKPVAVLAIGIAAVLGPHAMAASRRRSLGSARRLSKRFISLVCIAGVSYALLVGVDAPWNLVPRVLEHAYVIPGLLLLTILANVVTAIAMPYQAELLGANREKEISRAEGLGAAAQTAVASSAGAIGAYAVPLGALAIGLVRTIGYWRILWGHYPEESKAGLSRAPAPEPDGRLRVLISAFFCEPGAGSEAGVGWNTVCEMARHHRVWVLTQGRNREAIERGLGEPHTREVQFAYFDLPPWLQWANRESYWLRLSRQFYNYIWQLAGSRRIRRLHAEHGFHLTHHATVAKYWYPSILAVLDVPFLWGPVGGGESAPRRLWLALGPRGAAYEAVREVSRWLGERDPLVRRTARAASLTLATTEQTASRMRIHLSVEPLEVFSAIGLAEDEFLQLESEPEARDGQVRFLCVGNLIPFKGFSFALRAFMDADLDGSELWVIGDGPDRPRLESIVRPLDARSGIHFRGRLSRRETLAAYGRCDVLVHPSLHDSGGMVILEAMAAGLPVICLDLGGPALSVTDRTGFRIPATDPDGVVAGLSSAMRRLANDLELRRRMSRASRIRAREAYSWRGRGEILARIYAQLASDREADSAWALEPSRELRGPDEVPGG